MKKWQRISLISLAIVVLAIAGGLFAVHQKTYAPSPAATAAAQAARTTNYGEYFAAKPAKGPTVIFYPGALVAPRSYSVWAKQVARAGYPVAIVNMPLNLAVLGTNRAAKVPLTARGYVIGGHSLGGVMASRYARQHPKALHGVFFIASYPDQKGSLKSADLPVLSLTASRDGVLNWPAWRQAKRYLPATAQFAQLAGGDHAGFGSYGQQRGDQKATVTNRTQQAWIAGQLENWLAGL